MINIFPEFESRQVLTSDELNWMASYLDTQNRQSRRFLIGSGLIGGLQVKLVNNSVQITNGIGVTSAGHIILLSNDAAEVTTYTKAKKYTQKANEKLAFHYLSDMDLNEENYAKSVDVPSLYFTSFKSDVLELFEPTINDADPIDGNALKGKVAVLFAEILQKELKDCEGDNCQERGKKYIFSSKVLVISKEDALLLLNAEYNTQAQNEDAISRLAFPWMHLPDINILKPVFSNGSVNITYDEKLIVQEYLRCINDFVAALTSNKVQVEQSLKNLNNYCSAFSGNFTIVDQLIQKVTGTGVLNNGNPKPSQTATVYDYLWCFTKAYQELQAEAQCLKAKCFTQEKAFPNHILMGVIDTQNLDFESPVSAGYSVYRHYFQSRLVQTQQADLCKKITTYLKRLATLVTDFDDSIFTNKMEIKITAGGSLYRPLSHQAIPWYLKQSVASVWSPWSTHPNLNKYTTTYGSINESQVPSVQFPYNSLPSGFQGNHDFFRIEGVHRQTALDALNTVFQLRKKHGLAFEVLMLRLNEKAPFSHSFNFTINEDIESMYQVVRSEVLKQVSLNVNYLYALQLKTGKFDSIKTILTNELEQSYLIFLNNINVTVLSQPLAMVLDEAITASNITTNYKVEAFTDDAKYSELETVVSNDKAVTSSFFKMANVGITNTKFSGLNMLKINFGFKIGMFLFNTLGHLVNTIKTGDKFKSTSDISFYSHLLTVVKKMQKNEKNQLLFLYALQLYAALKLHEEYLSENFLELDITKYTDNLEDELLPASNALVDYLKKLTADSVGNDEILDVVIKDEMLSYAERIRFDDDWIKIIQLDAENKKRNGGLGVENLLERFVKLNPGMAHGCGVPKGGTYIMVYDSNNQVTADFYLPYIISSHLRPIQYTLVENKTLTLSGTIKDANAKPIETTFLVGTATVISDKQGFYNALVSENTTVKIVCNLAEYKTFEQDVAIKDKPQILNIVLQPVDVIKTTTTVKFLNQLGNPITSDIALLNITANKPANATKGVLLLNDMAKTKYKFEVKDENFEAKQFSIIIGDKDQEQPVPLTEIDFIRIQIVGDPEYIPSLLKNIKVVDPPMDLDTSDLLKGSFVTKERIDITKSATIDIVYNDKPIKQQIKAGEEVNTIIAKGVVDENPNVKLNTVLSIVYTEQEGISKIDSFVINDVKIPVNLETNIGGGSIISKGQLDMRSEFPNVTGLDIENFPNIKSVILILDSQVVKERRRITESSFLTFTLALTALQIRSLGAIRKEFRAIGKATDLRVENFFCILLPDQDMEGVRNLLGL